LVKWADADSLLHSPILADNFGRKLPIAIGCVIMVVGAVMQAACQNLGST
jgi:hypothetical protein